MQAVPMTTKYIWEFKRLDDVNSGRTNRVIEGILRLSPSCDFKTETPGTDRRTVCIRVV